MKQQSNDEGDPLTLALLSGVIFRKYATHNGPHYFYVTKEGREEPGYAYGSSAMPARSKQDAARAWLRALTAGELP